MSFLKKRLYEFSIKNIKANTIGYLLVLKWNTEKEHAIPTHKWSKFLNVILLMCVYFDTVFVIRIKSINMPRVIKKF
tara:strand:- start:220 stop:450 length:231 start_codon:yes stop_codon:yes gene_type:complete